MGSAPGCLEIIWDGGGKSFPGASPVDSYLVLLLPSLCLLQAPGDTASSLRDAHQYTTLDSFQILRGRPLLLPFYKLKPIKGNCPWDSDPVLCGSQSCLSYSTPPPQPSPVPVSPSLLPSTLHSLQLKAQSQAKEGRKTPPPKLFPLPLQAANGPSSQGRWGLCTLKQGPRTLTQEKVSSSLICQALRQILTPGAVPASSQFPCHKLSHACLPDVQGDSQ